MNIVRVRVTMALVGVTLFATFSASTTHSQTWRYSKKECTNFVAQMAYSTKLADKCGFAVRQKSVEVANECVSRLGKTRSDKAAGNGLKFATGFVERKKGAGLCTAIKREIGPVLTN